jgi:ABC-type molybdate transport system substrate-binding protein
VSVFALLHYSRGRRWIIAELESAAIATRSNNPKAAAAFLAFIVGPVGSDHLRRAGWDIDQ